MRDAGDHTPAPSNPARRGPDRADGEDAARQRLGRAVRRARLALLWEAIWPRLAPLTALAGLFVALSWLGFWRLTPDPLRFALVGAFAAVALWLLWRLLRVRAPGHAAALARVEQATGVDHRPATAFDDRLATPADPAALALWNAHRRRLLAKLRDLRAGAPAPKLARRDPYALRFAVVLALVIGFVAAGPERLERLGEAFRLGPPAAEVIARIDAWITPPAYTGRAPIFLTGAAARTDRDSYSVPAGSTLIVRTGDDRLAVVRRGAEGEVAVEPAARRVASADGAAPPLEHRVELAANGAVAVQRGGRDMLAWTFTVAPDRAPTIAHLQRPATEDNSLKLTYALADDYGVVGARAEIAPLARDDGRPTRPLYDAPDLPLTLPQLRTRGGNGETKRDLTAHPWAGANVTVTLVARDEIGQEGRSDAEVVKLPAHPFGNPLARAVAEQRTGLALDGGARYDVADALDALTLGNNIERAGDHLALRSAYQRLLLARDDDGLRDVADYLWEIALGIEEGATSPLMRDLQAAAERLRQALENDASEEEIARLTEELREAMRDLMQALAEQAMQAPQIADLPPDASQMLSDQDLERMLDRIEDLARSGSRDAARDLLNQLQNMLQNLQAGQPMMGDQQQAGDMMNQLNQLGDMIRRQEELMNRTFRADQGQSPDGESRPMTEQELADAIRRLQEGQQALSDALGELMQQLEDMQMGDEGQLGQAGEAMGEAAGSLGEGQPGDALGSQGRALQALRDGAESLMQQMTGQQGPGQNGPGGMVRGGDQPNADPLGRPRRITGPDLGTTVRVPDEIDTQRAREILEAIRRRLDEMGRPELERDYLERLLDQF